jgi:hypothetical protein
VFAGLEADVGELSHVDRGSVEKAAQSAHQIKNNKYNKIKDIMRNFGLFTLFYRERRAAQA